MPTMTMYVVKVIDNNDYNDYYNNYNDYNNNNDYRDSALDLDLDWERFSELVTLIVPLVTQLTITDKLLNLNRDFEG